MEKICSITGCLRSVRSKGWCSVHYYRWYEKGDPEAEVNSRDSSRVERFWAKVDKTSSPEGCWLWSGYTDKLGYGHFRSGKNKMTRAHIYSYKLHHGEIPQGLVIDHYLSCITSCVNPEHLKAVTQQKNMENRKGAQRRNPTGVRGVTRTPSGTFRAIIGYKGKALALGTYKTISEAEKVVVAKRLELYTNNYQDRK